MGLTSADTWDDAAGSIGLGVLQPVVPGSEEGSYVRLIDFVYHSTLCLRVIKRRESAAGAIGLGVLDPLVPAP